MTETRDKSADARRGFLRLLGGAVACAGAAAAGRVAIMPAEAAAEPSTVTPPAIPGYDWTKHRWAFGVDATKCIGCLRCVEACKRENEVMAMRTIAPGSNGTSTWKARKRRASTATAIR